MFGKVLVANRGEIAVRVIRGLRQMGIRSVAVFSDADRRSLAVQMADEAAYLGGSASGESYLRIDKILAAAREHGAEAIHPGYGFLSENAAFADACAEAGITFIGPSGDAIRKLGSKTGARKLAQEAGAPVVPGTKDAITDVEEARRVAGELGFPVLLKASAGGGGKGMRRVDRAEDLGAALRDASSEAERSFQDAAVYLEKLVVEPRHIEIQVLGDQHGNLIHLGERECSLQRRHQKVVEECPSPLMGSMPELREKMGEAALKVARAAGYYNAGTVEFLADQEGNFYFLEMNTRLQVEHPVTELVTGMDLVEWQLRIAAGEKLTVRQEEVGWWGSAIECRVYAEDPDQGFLPFPGKIRRLSEPQGPGVRLDSGVYEGWEVPLEYDPLLAKLCAYGESREEAIRVLDRALSEYTLLGIRTNIAYFREILADEVFHSGRLSTAFLDEFSRRRGAGPQESAEDRLAMEAAAALALAIEQRDRTSQPEATERPRSRWVSEGREELFRRAGTLG